MSMNNPGREQLFLSLHEELRNMSTETILFHQAIADRLQLNSTDHKCLDIILTNYPLTAGRLSELTGLTTGTVTGVLDRLEKAGYVYRDKDPDDRRRVMINVHLEKTKGDIVPLFDSFSHAMNGLFDQYDNDQLQLLLDFFKSNRLILREQTNQLTP